MEPGGAGRLASGWSRKLTARKGPSGPSAPTPPSSQTLSESFLVGRLRWDHGTQGHVGGLLRTLEKRGFSLALLDQSVQSVCPGAVDPDMTFFFKVDVY